jgi:hypothetical protein
MIDRACCDTGTSDQKDPKECLDKWKKELVQVCNEYNELAAKTTNSQAEYSNSLTWETKLKRWRELVETTDMKAGDVVNTLQFFTEQIAILCENSKCTVEGLEKITCLVKVIFNAFYTFEGYETGLKDAITEFKKEVECSNASDEDKAEVIKCIEAYEQKILLVCALQNSILAKLLETLKCAIKLDAYFCDEDSGLRKKIMQIIDDFELGLPVEEQCGTGEHHHEDENSDSDDAEFPCDPKKVKPKPLFRKGKANTYYVEIDKAYGLAVGKTKSLKEKWIKSKKRSDKKLSQKNSLTEAIKAAEAAENGK